MKQEKYKEAEKLRILDSFFRYCKEYKIYLLPEEKQFISQCIMRSQATNSQLKKWLDDYIKIYRESIEYDPEHGKDFAKARKKAATYLNKYTLTNKIIHS